MPVIKRFGAVSLRLYADDHHPPHFHIVGPEFQLLVRLSDLTTLAGEAHASDIVEVLAWARENQSLLARKWAELNERG